MSRNYICNSEHVFYGKGYICLAVELEHMPETLEYGTVTLLKKTRFHVSLVPVKDVVEKLGVEYEQKVLELFCEYHKTKPVSFTGFTGEFRHAKRPEEHGEDRETIVAMCNVASLDAFTDMVNERFGTELSHQPTHVTLYTKQENAGIGLNNQEQLQKLSEVIDPQQQIAHILEK